MTSNGTSTRFTTQDPVSRLRSVMRHVVVKHRSRRGQKLSGGIRRSKTKPNFTAAPLLSSPAMATRRVRSIAAALASSTSSSATVIQKSTAFIEESSSLRTIAGHGSSRTRWALFSSSSSSSSSSSFSSTESKKPRRKITDRLSAVIDAVNDRKLPPELRGQRNAVRSETDIINVVEQRIWHSMEEGEFENLPGKGKPLKLSRNPHADPAEDTLYRILSQNGCAPEWVVLNKEIRNRATEWRVALRKAWAQRGNQDDVKWDESTEALKLQLRDINDKVFRYNLIVPFGRQMFGLKWEKELERLKQEEV